MRKVGLFLMMEMVDRCRAIGLRATPRHLTTDARQQAAYCLDAPDSIPAGGYFSDETGIPEIGNLPMQLEIERE